MRFGCCMNMISTLPDGTGIEWIETIKKSRYDYVELPLAQMMELDAAGFAAFRDRVFALGLPCEACNNFFPGTLQLTGLDVDQEKIDRYLAEALDRAEQLGAKTIVFGSAKAKNVPEGFPRDKAWKQLVDLLRDMDEAVRPRGITIAIEPLNRQESNIINTVKEGLELAGEVNRKNIGVLVDYYHLVVEEESSDILLRAAGHLQHVHFARPEGRVFPSLQDVEEDYALFFSKLRQTGYNGRISVEAYTSNVRYDSQETFKLLAGLSA